MAKKKHRETVYIDGITPPGRLFPTAEAQEATRRLLDSWEELINSILRKRAPLQNFDETLKERLASIAKNYIDDRDYFNRFTTREVRSGVEPIRKAAEKLLIAIETMPNHSRAAVSKEYSFYNTRKDKQDHKFFKNFEQDLNILLDFSRNISKVKAKSGSPEKLHIKNAVGAASKLWEDISGEIFPRNADSEFIEKKNVDEFTSPGPEFVRMILVTIDPDTSVKEVGTAILRRSEN